MIKGYVVTYSDLSPHQRGEFWFPMLYENINDAIDAASSCMHNNGGIQGFKLMPEKDSDIVIRQWKNDTNTVRVWLEKLEVIKSEI